jgi:hypothetical protein
VEIQTVLESAHRGEGFHIFKTFFGIIFYLGAFGGVGALGWL